MSNQDNGGRYSKFQQRLRNIRLSRLKRKQFLKGNEEYIQEKIQEIREVVGKETVRSTRKVYIAVDDDSLKRNDIVSSNLKKEDVSSIKNSGNKALVDKNNNNDSKGSFLHKKGVSFNENVEETDEILSSSDNINFKLQEIKNRKTNTSISKKGYSYQDSSVKINKFKKYSDDEKKEQLEVFSAEIISKIKEQFEDHLDELEVLMSELYFLEKSQEKEVELKKVKEVKKEILQLIDRINNIIEQYNLYKNNYYIDNVVGINDNQIVDDMISYRALLDNVSSEKDFVREYKALDEFKKLYENLDAIRKKTIVLRDENEERIEELDIRDKKYDQIKLGVVKVDGLLKDCDEEIQRQNEYFNKLMSKIQKIDKEEYTTYHLRGIQELVGQSLRYLGFLMLSPLGGLLPGIAFHAMATKKMIGNVYQNLRVEEVQHVYYSAVDYDNELSHKLTDINYTSDVIDDTLRDIERLKDTFMLQYDSKIPGYENTLKKIDKIHSNIIRNQNRVEKIRERLRSSKKLNEKKMVRVKELNNG